MGRKRTRQVLFRLSDEERERLDELVARSALTEAEYLRRRSLSEKNIVVRDGQGLRTLIAAVNKIGSNINQIARMANSVGGVSKDEILKIAAWQEEIYRQVRELNNT
ncbi:MAG TPA: hypothetical protein DEB31_11290 [Clostridiales bacterium]|nr:hypothetical protein [Clostridiales bacterium]